MTPALALKVAKIIPRLASPHEGEVTASVAAIGRLLSSEQLDWHDVARRFVEPATLLAPRSPEAPVGYRASIDFALARADCLSDREIDFLTSLRPCTLRGYVPTIRQAAWIADIVDRLTSQGPR